jgi:spore coat polysaccharide biosynthesis protein SpsF (cytidylyltransferase family)
VDKKPEDLGHGVTMEEVQEVFFKGSNEDILERAVGIIEDTQNQHKRGSQTLDVCFNLEIVKRMINYANKEKVNAK